jgi:hypothetical protein
MSSPVLWGPNNIANNLQNQELLATGALLAWNGPKNYITYNNFENGLTTGWALGTIGTLTNGIPTGSPNFSGSTTSLTLQTTTSSPLSGTTSLQLVASAATTQGNMIATQAYPIDIEDQAKVLTFKFYYSTVSGTLNLSGTSSNSFGIAIWDATNSVWLTSTANFGMTQSSGTGYVTGTCQTNSTTTSVNFCIYAANATSGAATLNFDDFFLGPQTAPFGPAVSDWVAYTPTFTGLGTVTGVSANSRRVGDSLEVKGKVTSGTSTATPGLISLGFDGGNSNVSIDTTKVPASSVVGSAFLSAASTTTFGWSILAPATNLSTVTIGFQSSTVGGTTTTTNASTTIGTGATFEFYFSVPIVGWSSNLQMSNDTDTRVVAMQVQQAAPTATVTGTPSLLKFTSGVQQDTHGAFSTSTGLYTVPVTGFYRVTGGVAVSGTFTTTNQVLLAIAHNGSIVQQNGQSAGGADGNIPVQISGTVFCNAGDTLATFVASSGTGLSIQSQANQNYLNIERLSGPSVIAATESVNARYFAATATVTGTDSNITYTTKDFDSHNAYSGSTYTIPVSGKYQMNAFITVTATYSTTNQTTTSIYKNGSQISEGRNVVSGNPTVIQAAVVDIINCNAGDAITFRVMSSGGTPTVSASNVFNYFSLSRVGN